MFKKVLIGTTCTVVSVNNAVRMNDVLEKAEKERVKISLLEKSTVPYVP